MKFLKTTFILISLLYLLNACGSAMQSTDKALKEEPVIIANDSLAYEIIIFDIGFTAYLASVAQPAGFYSQHYMETRNRNWVLTWNLRAQSPTRNTATIYENIIDYQPQVDYGYEVNYKLFNYFLFAQRKYNINLGGGFRTERIN